MLTFFLALDSTPPPPTPVPPKEEEEEEEENIPFLVSFFIVFNRLTVAYKLSFCSLTKVITPKMCKLCACVTINKRSFESFMYLGLVLER